MFFFLKHFVIIIMDNREKREQLNLSFNSSHLMNHEGSTQQLNSTGCKDFAAHTSDIKGQRLYTSCNK